MSFFGKLWFTYMIFTVTPNPVLDRTLTVREIVFDEMTRALSVREDLGGKGFNVSRALQALGVASEALGIVGGATGQKLATGLHALGISCDLTPIAGETRTNVVIAEAGSARYIKVNEPGPALSEAELAVFFGRIRAKVRAGDWWALCGSLPPGVPPDFYARLVGLIQGQGASALLDTAGEPLRLGLAAHPYLVKPNAVEATDLTGIAINSDESACEAAVALLKMGAQRVALSLGADGLLWMAPEGWGRVRPPQVRVKNPTGAGDALLAGILRALVEGLSCAEIARWGVAAGTAAALQEGVGVGAPSDVLALYEQLTFKPSVAEV